MTRKAAERVAPTEGKANEAKCAHGDYQQLKTNLKKSSFEPSAMSASPSSGGVEGGSPAGHRSRVARFEAHIAPLFAPKWHSVAENRPIMGDYDTQNPCGKVFVYTYSVTRWRASYDS